MAKKESDEGLSIEERLLRVQERQLDLQESALKVQQAQVKQTAPKSNTVPPKISVFNPRGEKDFPMPTLKCDVYAPWKLSPQMHSLDREEVELFNLLEPGDDYLVELNDGAIQRICVIGVRNHASGQLESLALKGPKDDTGLYGGLFTNENKQQFPALKTMLRQMVGDKAAGVKPMRVEVAEIAAGDLPVSVGA